jgi:membrane-associated phospholipid phosphatase
MRGIRFRTPEWILLGFFTYIALLSLIFRDRPHLRGQPWIVLLAVAALFCALILIERGRSKRAVEIARDWLPVLLTFMAFREMEFFLPRDYNSAYEFAWIRWDRILLHDWGLRAAVEDCGKVLPFYFEFCYLLVYGVAAYGVGLLSGGPRRSIDRFWVVYLLGTLGAYALFPYFPTRPPRYVFPDMEPPQISTWVRHFNLFLLSRATIHVGVFPSAHVSAAFASAWGMFLAKPARRRWGWVLLVYAISVAIATIYGRYHYAADALAGFAVSVAAAACLYTYDSIGKRRRLLPDKINSKQRERT